MLNRRIVILLSLVAAGACRERAATSPVQASHLAVVSRRDVVVSAIAAGVVEPVKTIEVKSKASGEIVEVSVEEGDRVSKGELLVRVDPRIPRNAVAQAEADSLVARAQLDNADAQLERSTELRASQAITQLEFEQARLARATAYAALIRARRALEDAKISYEDTEVRAPSDGVVLGRAVEVGSVITSASRDVGGGAVLLRMAALDTVQVRALVDETDIGMVHPGLPVTIQVSAYPNRRFVGDVLRIGAEAVVDQNVTNFPVLIRIANRDALLRPGMNAEVEVHIGNVQDALTVPNAALRPRSDVPAAARFLGLSPDTVARELDAASGEEEGLPVTGADGETGSSVLGGEYVAFVRDSGRYRAVRVQAGLTDFDYTVIESGLTQGDTVAVLPTTGLIEEQERRADWMRRRAGGPLSGGD